MMSHCNRVTSGFCSDAGGSQTRALGDASRAEGSVTTAIGRGSHAEGQQTTAVGEASHAEGFLPIAFAFASHAEGFQTQARGDISHAEGQHTAAFGLGSHAEGFGTQATGIYTHAEGSRTVASGVASHSEGLANRSIGNYSHAEGQNTLAGGLASHAEGSYCQALGTFSHAEGQQTIASGFLSHSEGFQTNTNMKNAAHIMGGYGDATDHNSWHLANGTGPSNRSLAAKIVNDGRGVADLGWVMGNADYAEMFETVDGHSIDVGYFVMLDGDKVRKANASDGYILGITSATPAVLGNGGDLRWKNKYITDEWGRIQYHNVIIPAVKDQQGNVIIPERLETQPVLNPEWDNKRDYISRLERKEWVTVGLLGQILVRDDGTCQVNGYCKSNNNGIATASSEGYRVMKRTGINQILVMYR